MSAPDWSKAPEWATHYLPGNGGNPYHALWLEMDGERVLSVGHEGVSHRTFTYSDSDQPSTNISGRIARPAAWNGEGLPPVGTVCEIAGSTQYLKISHPEGATVKVYANFTDDRGVELAAFVDSLGNVAGVAIAKCFRPIRTPEQIAAEEREKAVMEIGTILIDNRGSCNEYHLAGLLHDAGYRKTEAPK